MRNRRSAPLGRGCTDGATSDLASNADAGVSGGQPRVRVWLGETYGALDTCDADTRNAIRNSLLRHRLLIIVELDEGGAVAASSATLGVGEAPSPATDPDGPYPPDADPTCTMMQPVPGVEYPVHHALLTSSRLELTFYPSEIYASWCALHDSFPASTMAQKQWRQDYLCEPSDHILTLDDVNAVHGARPPQCLGDFNRVCDCTADECRARQFLPITLDVLIDGDRMEGRLVDDLVGLTEVKLERVR